MKNKTSKKLKTADNIILCSKCGKEIKGWGVDGCPTVNKGAEMGALFGNFTGWIHYKCMDYH